MGVFNVNRCLSGLFKHQRWKKRDGSSPLYSHPSLKELEWKSCFYKLMTSAAQLNILEPQESERSESDAESQQSDERLYVH